jgi:DNA-binding winged helix-turn-helix (wHTH) protein
LASDKRRQGVMQQLLMPRQFTHQPMLHWDPPSTSRQEVSASGHAVIRFGRSRVLPRARKLIVDRQPVELGGRAFDLLMVLIRAPGTLVTKNEIVSRVWPDVVVAEGNLKVQMSALRKVLNEDRDVIKTVHGRGYVFTGEVTMASVEADALVGADSGSTPPPLAPALPARFSAWSSPRRQWATGSRMVATGDKAEPVVDVIEDDPDIRSAEAMIPLPGSSKARKGESKSDGRQSAPRRKRRYGRRWLRVKQFSG